MIFFRRLIISALCLAFAVVVLGAYVRLSDAGLGCPDWPGCYGHISPHHAAERIAAAESMQPSGPVSQPKAWKEMIHRYFAGTLGLLILSIAVVAWTKKWDMAHGRGLPGLLLLVVVFQALLGMWTVTERLKPLVVTGHLIGGMTTLALLTWLWLRETKVYDASYLPQAPWLKPWAVLGLALLAAQIILGGWVSTNYAALACPDFPTCQGAWVPNMDFAQAFTLRRELGMDGRGALLTHEALTAIHWSHRLGALVVFVYLGWLGSKMLKIPGFKLIGMTVLGLLSVQALLGITNVLASLPLPIAVAHNAGAALLLMTLVTLNFKLTA
jgi:cytochrome c oxidase assembly protein subunit 15